MVLVLLIFYIIYRAGQSLSMSGFSFRQSIPAEMCIFAMLPGIFYIEDNLRMRNITFTLALVIMVGFTIGRLYIRGQI